jgi:nitroimidazol reductase NimA-like FMN-containing flavoprotein (pyridoxamine 5'-phosphate oxidase superfamily)
MAKGAHMNGKHLELARRIVQDIKYMAIATVSKAGEPWNSPVYCAFDADYNFYWASDREACHSRNIRENPRVFLAIYDSTVPEGTGRGVYVQAKAVELDNPEEIREGLVQLDRRVGEPHQTPDHFMGAMHRRVYRANPQRVWVNDVGTRAGQPIDVRVEVGIL